MQHHHPELDLLLNEVAELHPLPVVAVRVLEIAESAQFSAHELAQAIATDQALTAKVLRLSNSAYYGFPRRITTVRDAVVLLGFRAIRSATVASCVMDALPGASNLSTHQAWRYSVTVGLLAEVLSRATRRHVDEAFTAGVVHNVGRLALDQRRPRWLKQARDLARGEGIPIHSAQRQLFGFTDADVGGALALQWNFPPALAEAVAQHDLEVDHLPDPGSLAAFVIRARMFARASGVTDGYEDAGSESTDAAWTEPPISDTLKQIGGFEGILERVSAFIESTGAPGGR